MKKIVLATLLLSCSFLSSAEQKPEWKTRSIEKQFSQSRAVTTKSSTQLASSADSTPMLSKQQAPAQTLAARPVIDDPDFWIYDAWVTLEKDTDYDGYYHNIILEFDADTVYAHASVYARLYLSSGGDFYEYHTTDYFHIDGENSQDSYVVETDLLEGFPPNDYELLIELYDTDTDELVATLDGYDDADLYLLPLESNNHEHRSGGQVTVTTEHGGSLGLCAAIMLLIFACYRHRATGSNRQP
ncbi:choice-of-anchor H family protein [Neptunicella sp. SCSIO 80796]|uniref:choice-of-anchor H family protein n=1 Tax=Neptunicella plasticusilytica TaxID=3117012 RepID=UPI003A4D8A51